MAEQARLIDGKKFMWDGEEYEGEKEAKAAQKQYEENGFEVEMCRDDDGKVLLYTRRVVTEIVLE
ncbi:MAG: hypothetical protein JXA81_14560 [Sedimentisphaerales bacterium]|jgi:hypothetical protein|nr:hypothetical protein [Sedimentisphaerales bacterium]